MRMELSQIQSLKLNLTTELKQSLEMLQCSALELKDFLYEQALQNPLVSLQSFEQSGYKKSRKTNKNAKQKEVHEWFMQHEETLYEHLLKQVWDMGISGEMRRTVEYIIHNLDERGYLVQSLEEMAEQKHTNLFTLTEALSLVQEMEPIGVGARSIQECLFLHAKYRKPIDLTLIKIVDQYFEQLIKRNWKKIMNDLSLSKEQLQHYIEVLSSFDVKPGSSFFNRNAQIIVPDVVVEREKLGWKVSFNEDSIPHIELDDQWLQGKKLEKEEKRYIKQCHKHAKWIFDSIAQRKETLIKVTEAILNRQPQVIQEGFGVLTPLNMKEIADEVNLHESTISRTVRGKYIKLPHGTYEIREFFSNGFQGEQGDVSIRTIKDKLRDLIKGEKKDKPFSDQKLSELIQCEYNIQISRRTIAKYREEMGIPSSAKRKNVS